MKKEKNISKFSSDSKKLGGYVYTSNHKLSSKIANDYQTKNILSLVKIKNKSVFDIGCGDGTYTYELFSKGKPNSIYAIDPAKNAISSAKKNNPNPRKIKFLVGNIYKLPKKKFDVAVVRGVLHHLYNAEAAVNEISKVAKKVIFVEPNGYNPILKIIEKTSTYHIEHEEKSYPPSKINRWITQNNGKILVKRYLGLVPFFCPDWFALMLKRLEPIVESIPVMNALMCANYYVVYENKKKTK